MHRYRPISRALGRHRNLFLTLTCLVCLGTVMLPSGSAQPTVPPQPTQPPIPTVPPVPTFPPQPTQPPFPTVPPVSTVPPQPTQIPEPTTPSTETPTEVPTEIPTEAPTAVPTEQPPATPTAPPVQPTQPPLPTLPPQPTQPPATESVADATITCELAGTRDPGTPAPKPIPVDDAWTLYACDIALDFGPVASLALRGETNTPGWRVILVDEDAPNTPGLLNASNDRLELDGLDGEPAATFLIGVQPSCTAFKTATIDLDITGTRPGPDGATVETTGRVPLTVPSEAPPGVTLESLTFTNDGDATLASFEIGYANVPARCGWQLLVTLALADSSAVTVDTFDGPEGSTSAIANGVISILIPAAEDDVSKGTIRIDAQFPSDGDATVETVIVEAVTFP